MPLVMVEIGFVSAVKGWSEHWAEMTLSWDLRVLVWLSTIIDRRFQPLFGETEAAAESFPGI